MVADNGDDIGKVKDFYFDSNQLIVRYAIVDTGGWLSGRKVLISPGAFQKPNWEEKEFPREYEEDLYLHYGKDRYW